ncbi:MAG: glycosyltransferase family 4 protein [Planctomycetota bacterium]
MRVLLCHNYYQQAGGEDQVFADEGQLLESRGNEVLRYSLHNNVIDHMGGLEVALRTVWNRTTYRELLNLMRREKPDVIHFSNTFPLISPAAYYAAREAGVPVVQTLHNYRLMCPDAGFYRDGAPCEDCLKRIVPWPAVLHGCYRSSRSASGVVATMTLVHKLLGTWQRCVDRYITLSRFSAEKFVAGGLPTGKIVVKPNFIWTDPGTGAGLGNYAVSVGRLAKEKGIANLLDAWERIGTKVPLKIIGVGPMQEEIEKRAAGLPGVEWLGRKKLDEVMRIVGDAACLVQPSGLYENCPKTLLEAFAVGTPVVASRLGALEEMVSDGVNGLGFSPRDPDDLAEKVCRIADDPKFRAELRTGARQSYESLYTADRNYELLMSIYASVCEPGAVAYSTDVVEASEAVAAPPMADVS